MPPAYRPLAALACVLALIAGCSTGRPGTGAADARRSPEPQVYVAVGASETVGVGAAEPASQAWPTVLHDAVLPRTRLVNVGVSGATVRDALATQVPVARRARPDVVTVWLAVNDLITRVPVRAYERRLSRLVERLREAGAREILIGNVPRLWRLPAYRDCLPSASTRAACALPFVPPEPLVRAWVRDYNAAIRRVARSGPARLVDLSREVPAARLVSADGFHPSAAGHRRIAAAFAEALAPPR